MADALSRNTCAHNIYKCLPLDPQLNQDTPPVKGNNRKWTIHIGLVPCTGGEAGLGMALCPSLAATGEGDTQSSGGGTASGGGDGGARAAAIDALLNALQTVTDTLSSGGETAAQEADAAAGAAPRFIANSAGDVLDTSRVTVPEGKFSYLLENPSKAGVFGDSMGFDKATLNSALRKQLVENFNNASPEIPMFDGKGAQIGVKFTVRSALTGPSGATWDITSAWGIDWNGTVRLITATP